MLEPTSTDSGPENPLGFFEALGPAQIVFLGISLFMLNQLLASVLFSILSDLTLASLLATALTFIVVPMVALSRFQGGIVQTLRLHRLSGTQLLLLALLASVASLPANFCAQLSSSWLEVPPEHAELLEQLRPSTPTQWAVGLLGICVVAPIGEEILFRGVLQQVVRFSMGGIWAPVLCGLLFGVLHFQPWLVLGLAFMGIMMGLAFEVTGSLWAPIVVHAVFNLIALGSLAQSGESQASPLETPLTAGGLAIAGSLAAAWTLRKLATMASWEEPWPGLDSDAPTWSSGRSSSPD